MRSSKAEEGVAESIGKVDRVSDVSTAYPGPTARLSSKARG